MLFSGYKVEILVNDKPLEEFYEYIEKGKPTTTGPSYIYNELTLRKTESNQIHYAAVEDPGASFKIRYEVPVNSTLPGPIMAMVYVDGQYDYTYVPIVRHEERIQVKDGFTHVAKNVKYGFKFDVMLWRENDKRNTIVKNELENTEFKIPKIGGLGAVSVCFYRAEHHYQRVKPIEFDIKQPVIPEETKDLDLEFQFATSFDEISIPASTPSESVLKQKSNQPLAVVHLHYRSKSWLIDRNTLNNLQELTPKREVPPGLSFPPPLSSSISKSFTLPCPSNILSPSILNNVLTETSVHDSVSNVSNANQSNTAGNDNKKPKNSEKSVEVKNKINGSKNNNLVNTNDSIENEEIPGNHKILTKADLKKWWSRWRSPPQGENVDPGQKSKSEIHDENEISPVQASAKGRNKKKRKITDSEEISMISSD